MKQPSPKCIKILKTCNLCIAFFVLGLGFALIGPCYLDLQRIVQADIDHMGVIYTGRAAGFIVGCTLGGILLDATKFKQAVLGICSGIAAIAMLILPWSRSLGALTGCMIVWGFVGGFINTGCNVLCLNLWGSESGPYYQALHLTFGLGCLAAPLGAAPFLESSKFSMPVEINGAIYPNNSGNFTNQSDITSSAPNIVYPFMFTGGLTLFSTFMLLGVCTVSPVEDVAQSKSKEVDRISMGLIYFLVFLCSLLLFVEAGAEIGFSQLVSTYAVLGRLHLSAVTGSYLTSAFWGSLCVARALSVFVAIKVSDFTMIVWDMVISVIGSFVLLLLASYEWALWLASVLLGVGIASFIPAVTTWLSSYINITNKRASVIFGSPVLGEMALPAAISYFIETIPEVLLYTVAISTCLCCFIVLVLYLILRKMKKKDEETVRFNELSMTESDAATSLSSCPTTYNTVKTEK